MTVLFFEWVVCNARGNMWKQIAQLLSFQRKPFIVKISRNGLLNPTLLEATLVNAAHPFAVLGEKAVHLWVSKYFAANIFPTDAISKSINAKRHIYIIYFHLSGVKLSHNRSNLEKQKGGDSIGHRNTCHPSCPFDQSAKMGQTGYEFDYGKVIPGKAQSIFFVCAAG